jgi:type I restriction enzyme, S subunit
MKVKPGYKRTEMGVIPEEWEVTTIGEQSQIFGRIGFRGYTVEDIVEEGHGAIAINPSNIQDGETVFEKCTYISWRKYEESPEIKIDEGDIILVKTGSTVGKTAMVKKLPEKATLNPQVVVFKKLKASPGFFGYMMGFPVVQKQITEAVVGGAVPTLSQKLVAAFKFLLPPPPEQHAIATALSDVDGLLSRLDRLIAKKRDLKQAAIQQLLTGQTRLPGFVGKWEVKNLAAICQMKSGEAITGSAIDQFSRYPCYGGNGPRGFTSRYTHDGSYALVGRQGALCGNVFGVKGKFFASEHAVVVTALPRTDIRWLTRVLARMNLNQYSESSAQPGLSVSKILKLEVTCPPTLAEQTAIADILTTMDDELAALERRRDKTRALKQAMMQELLTGKTRLT